MDGSLFSRAFADNAEFTNILGLTARGKQVMANGHHEIFSTPFYRGTRLNGWDYSNETGSGLIGNCHHAVKELDNMHFPQ